MALKRLLTEEMIQVSTTWKDPKSKARKAILATPELAPLVPRVDGAHDALAAAGQPSTDDPRLGEISAEEGKIDIRHDDIIRGSHLFLTGASLLLGEDNGGAELIILRDTLIPDGLQSTQKSYRAEAGQAAQLDKRLTPDVRSDLEAISVGPKSAKAALMQFIDEWVTLGGELGTLEDEKGRLQATPVDPGTGAGAALLKARNTWVRVVNAMVANAELAEIDPEVDALVFGPLRAAESAADRRGRPTKGKGGAPGGDPTGGDPTKGGQGGDK